jgi:hypothetical protein
MGLQRSVREWALRQGWRVRQGQAQAILVAVLGVMAVHGDHNHATRVS